MKAALFATLLLLTITALPVKAQLKGFSLGPYVERAWPAGKTESHSKNGLGGGLSADIKLPGGFGLTGSAGFMRFGGRTESTQSGDIRYPSINAIPLRAGLKFRPLPLIYLKLEAGAAKFTNGNESAFLLSPGIGVRLAGIDIQGKYETWYADRKINFWGIRAGLNL